VSVTTTSAARHSKATKMRHSTGEGAIAYGELKVMDHEFVTQSSSAQMSASHTSTKPSSYPYGPPVPPYNRALADAAAAMRSAADCGESLGSGRPYGAGAAAVGCTGAY